MSISSLTGVALARNSANPTTKAESGENPTDTGHTQDASLATLLVKQVPTGLVAAYTALTAALVELTKPTDSDPNPDQLLGYRWVAFGIMVVTSFVLTYLSYRSKAEAGARQPVAELIGVTVAAAGWGLVTPESPALAQAEGSSGVALVLVIAFVATAINLAVAARLKQPAT